MTSCQVRLLETRVANEKEAGYDKGFAVQLAYLEEDRRLGSTAEVLRQDLCQVNMDAKLFAVPRAMMDGSRMETIAAGRPVV